MERRHLQEHDRQYRVFLYVFYACAVVMASITFFGVYSMAQDWNEEGTFIMGDILVQTQIPFENFANLSTWLFFSCVIGWYCVSRIGWPEARIILSQTTIYLAKAPKNNSSYLAIQLALEEVNKPIKYDVPLHLRNSTNSVSKRFNYGKGYKNPHNNLLENKIEYLPKKLRGKKFFNEQSSI